MGCSWNGNSVLTDAGMMTASVVSAAKVLGSLGKDSRTRGSATIAVGPVDLRLLAMVALLALCCLISWAMVPLWTTPIT